MPSPSLGLATALPSPPWNTWRHWHSLLARGTGGIYSAKARGSRRVALGKGSAQRCPELYVTNIYIIYIYRVQLMTHSSCCLTLCKMQEIYGNPQFIELQRTYTHLIFLYLHERGRGRMMMNGWMTISLFRDPAMPLTRPTHLILLGIVENSAKQFVQNVWKNGLQIRKSAQDSAIRSGIFPSSLHIFAIFPLQKYHTLWD